MATNPLSAMLCMFARKLFSNEFFRIGFRLGIDSDFRVTQTGRSFEQPLFTLIGTDLTLRFHADSFIKHSMAFCNQIMSAVVVREHAAGLWRHQAEELGG